MNVIIGVLLCFTICWRSIAMNETIIEAVTETMDEAVNENINETVTDVEASDPQLDYPFYRWFEQKLNHFDATDLRTWKQRYSVNWKNYKEGVPVFLILSNNETMDYIYGTQTNATQFDAIYIYIFRTSILCNTTTENLVYLDSEQSLADIVEFIENIPKLWILPSEVKWIVIGQFYGGSLATWMRMKYPHLVHAAISLSAPLLAKIDFQEYYEVVENVLAKHSPECVSQIKSANQVINTLLTTDEGAVEIQEKLKLCSPLDRHNKKDVARLFESLAHTFRDVVEYKNKNYDYRVRIEQYCNIMVDNSLPNALDRYAAVISEHSSDNCIGNYGQLIDSLMDTSWNATADRIWTYQRCSEFGLFQTSGQGDHLFGDNIPVDYFLDMCTDVFGKSYNKEFLSEAVKRTNTLFGGLDIRTDRVIFVRGLNDPWQPINITHTRNNFVIYINGTSGFDDLFNPLQTVFPQIKKFLKLVVDNDFF